MELGNARILLTGASGGLGSALARSLSWAGAEILLAGRDAGKLNALREHLRTRSDVVVADLNREEGIAAVARAARDFDINVLINNAGVGGFGLLDHQGWEEVERTLSTNLLTPIRLTQALLPWLKAQPQAAIVNVGSTFGSIPFAGFAAYSAAKAGLRGFSQALRRELADSRVDVIHLAPRAIDTPLNSAAVNALNRALGNRSDTPEAAARKIVAAAPNSRKASMPGARRPAAIPSRSMCTICARNWGRISSAPCVASATNWEKPRNEGAATGRHPVLALAAAANGQHRCPHDLDADGPAQLPAGPPRSRGVP